MNGWWRGGGAAVWLSAACLGLFYTVAVFAPFVAPYDYGEQNRSFPNCPPSAIHWRLPRQWGESFLYTHPQRIVDMTSRRYEPDTSVEVPIHFFTAGHLFRVPLDGPKFFLLGTDGLGRDLFSRLVYGSRVSLAVGLIGVAVSTAIGLLVGSVAGYFGGRTDNVLMRVVDIEMTLPPFFLLLALAAVIPSGISPELTFLLIVTILSLIRWAGFARIIRGMVAAVREAEYVHAARVLGATHARIILRHIVPATFSYTIVSATLSIPSFILSESALSLLGLGIQEPGASWGNMLAAAQNVQNLVKYPWILTPGLFIFLTVMSFNFLGDHLRDRLDPRAMVR